MKKKFPTLYKKTSAGAIQFWEILADLHGAGFGRIETCYGQLGTDKPQVTEDIIEEGKNEGKKNETTPYEQACSEAKSMWEKKKKSGYVESVSGAEAGDRDALITGGTDPMLAHHYMDVIYDLRPGHEDEVHYELSKDSKKIKFPCFFQPKLDGIRCLAMLVNGRCTLWTRTRKPIKSCPHIQEKLESLFPGATVTLDGELYNHDYKKDFEKIVSAVRQDEPTPEAKLVEYHIYDLVDFKKTFDKRQGFLNAALVGCAAPIKLVQCFADGKESVISLFERFCKEGYEGAMLRNSESLYVGKRSYDLQKAKPFQDDEFEIVGFAEGRGKLAGHLGAWICKTKAGDTFDPPMNKEQAILKKMFENGKSYIGKMLTVRFQGYTGKNKVPRFPKGHEVRDYE